MQPRHQAMLVLLALASMNPARAAEGHFQAPPPPGPWVGLTEADFAEAQTLRSCDPILVTTFFYWYDCRTGQNMTYADGRSAFRHTPAGVEDYSYLSVDWHKRQLRDMAAAGIDVVLPVYWGDPTRKALWSFEGLKRLVQAREELVAAGERAPCIGMFHATISLEWGPDGKVDLTTPFGREWFYTTVRDFWSMIPPRHWAMVDDKPLIFLYVASYARAHDQGCIEDLRRWFARDFAGRTPWIVRERSWNVKTEGCYGWGGAVGPIIMDVAAIGPGYDDSVVPGRTPLIVDRENGQFYIRSWEKLLCLPPPVRPRMAHIETWNELHEGTEICETEDFGRLYIDLTRQYGDLYRAGVRMPPGGQYAGAEAIWCEPGVGVDGGLRLLPEVGDGPSEAGVRAGRACRISTRNPYGDADYMYFDADDSFAFWELDQPFVLQVSYLDGGRGTLFVQYDSTDPEGSVAEGAFKCAGGVELTGTGVWRTCQFRLPDARCSNRTHGGDFRLATLGTPIVVARLEMRRVGGGKSGPD